MRRLIVLAAVFSVVLSLDAFVKYVVFTNVPTAPWAVPYYPYGGIGVFESVLGVDFAINHVHNRGSAWGLFANWHNLLLAVRILAITALSVYLVFWNKIRARDIPLTLIIAGALGNVVDCFVYGHVIDMFHFVLWGWSCPVFNVADSCIFIGVVVMLLQSMFTGEKRGSHLSTEDQHPSS